MNSPSPVSPASAGPAALRGPGAALRGDWPGLIAIASGGLAASAGVYATMRLGQVPPQAATVGAVAMSLVWCVLAGPGASAGRAGWGLWLRAAVVVDSAGLGLVAVWMAGGAMDLAGLGKVYALLATQTLALTAIVAMGRALWARQVLAVVAAMLTMAILAGPLWLDGLAVAQAPDEPASIVSAGLAWNTQYGLGAALARRTGFVWHMAGVMYRITWIGEDIPLTPIAWHQPLWRWAVVGAAAGALALLRARKQERRKWHDSTTSA